MKTFTAKSMPEVLALVKQTYGSHGVILHTRSYKKGGILGMGGRQVVEVTATDGRQLAQKYQRKTDQSARRRSLQPRQSLADLMPAGRPQPPAEAPPTPSQPQPSAGDLIRKTYAAARADLGAKSAAQRIDPPQRTSDRHKVVAAESEPNTNSPASPVPPPSSPVNLQTPAQVVIQQPARDHQLTEELSAMKQMMVKMMRQQKGSSAAKSDEGSLCTPELPDPLVTHYLKLIEQEVAEELAEEIVTKVSGFLKDEQLSEPSLVHRAVHDEIARRLPVEQCAGQLEKPKDGRPRTIALIGPTGVGKTTTIAKLAATFKLKQSKKVGLITMDTYRIAAVEQLRTYAGIIGLPLKVVNTDAQLAEAIAGYQDLDAILIDTAGRSQKASDKLVELKQVLAAADPHEVHLVLSSTVSQKVLLQTIDRFSAVDADRIIFTKLDEAVTGGVILNVAKRVGKKVSYITTGQEVPHEIEPGDSGRLADLVMGGGSERGGE
ncbi:MAG: flagellar biosynthesis protein FlhF [Phycisphaeraceae bacterium]